MAGKEEEDVHKKVRAAEGRTPAELSLHSDVCEGEGEQGSFVVGIFTGLLFNVRQS